MLCFDLVIIFLVCIRFRKSGAGGVTHLSPSSDDLNLENLKDVINWILIGSDGLQVIPGSASKSKCKWRKEFVSVTGLEPMLSDPESDVLPLHNTAMKKPARPKSCGRISILCLILIHHISSTASTLQPLC